MRRDLLEALIMSAMFGSSSKPQTVRVVEDPSFTRNLFGDISEITGKELTVLERNDRGDCLCLFKGEAGQNIVDVDYRDISRP